MKTPHATGCRAARYQAAHWISIRTRDVMNRILRSWNDDWQSQIGRERIFRVRWLLNPDQPPLENVEIVEQDGRIAEIRRLSVSARDVLPVILIPTLVNAHTHLEFSSLSEPIHPALPFQEWINAVIRWRRDGGTMRGEAVRRGLAESLENGVTSVGEITTSAHVCLDHITQGCSGCQCIRASCHEFVDCAVVKDVASGTQMREVTIKKQVAISLIACAIKRAVHSDNATHG